MIFVSRELTFSSNNDLNPTDILIDLLCFFQIYYSNYDICITRINFKETWWCLFILKVFILTNHYQEILEISCYHSCLLISSRENFLAKYIHQSDFPINSLKNRWMTQHWLWHGSPIENLQLFCRFIDYQ